MNTCIIISSNTLSPEIMQIELKLLMWKYVIIRMYLHLHFHSLCSSCVCLWMCAVLWGFHCKDLCQCSCRHLNRHETHFQWDTNHLFLSQQRAVLQCQPSAISTGISFLAEHWQAFRVSWGHSRPREDQRAPNKWSPGQHRVYCEGLWQVNHKKVSDRRWGPITNRIKGPTVLSYMCSLSL